MLLFASPALASSFILSAGLDTELGGGNWARATPDGASWQLFYAAGGTYWRAPMGPDLLVDEHGRQDLTGHTDLQDHALVQCPDGTWLHLASATTEAPDDTAWLFRHDPDFLETEASCVVDGDLGVRTNDMALLCDPDGVGWVGFTGGPTGQSVYQLAEDDTLDLVVADTSLPQMMGGSLVYEEGRDTVMALGRSYGDELHGARLDLGGDVLEYRVELGLADEGEDAYWPTTTLRIGEHYVVAYMWRVDDGNFQLDEGNVRLAVFDADWELREVYEVTDYAPPMGAMRPSITLSGDQLLVLWDRDNTTHATTLTLDLDAFDAPEEEGALEPEAVGCATSSTRSGWAAVFALAGVLRRRPKSGISLSSANG